MKKNIMISGAGGILGRAFISKLLDNGFTVFASEIDDQAVQKLINAFNNDKNLHVAECNVTSEDDIASWFAGVSSEHEIDIVINNASITSEFLRSIDEIPNKFEDTSLESWNLSLQTNLTGSFLIAREFGKCIKSTSDISSTRKLINLASMYALHGPDHSIYEGTTIKSFAAYSSSKAGIIGLTKWLATYWGQHNVTVNALAPGGVFNNHEDIFKDRLEKKIPLNRMASSEDIASVLLFLVSDQSNYMTGQVLYADGGYTSL
jgi:3-oxoacyl-[acyl-carrier protein] reductase